MDVSTPSDPPPLRPPPRYSVALAYALVSATWIALSDYLLAWAGGGLLMHTLKGVAFVAVTSLLLHSLVQRYAARVREYDRRLHENARLKYLGQLNALVSHEVRNVLMGARTMTSILARRVTSDAQGESAVRHLAAAYQRAETLLSEILTFAAPQDPKPEWVMLRPWLAELADWLRPTLKSGMKLEIANVGDLVLYADSTQLHVLLTNLVLNANEVAEHGHIRIGAAATQSPYGPGVTLTVRDDGPGIPPEIAGRIFEPLFTTRRTGTGLGLAIAERIAHAHGGTISFASAPGAGTAFHVFFPDSAEALARP